jgi:hypothetical protein
MTPEQAGLLAEIAAARQGSAALDERIARLLDLPPPAPIVADCGAVILDEDRKFTRSLSATRRLIAAASSWRVAEGPPGAAVEETVARAVTRSGETRSAELAFALAALSWLWGRAA